MEGIAESILRLHQPIFFPRENTKLVSRCIDKKNVDYKPKTRPIHPTTQGMNRINYCETHVTTNTTKLSSAYMPTTGAHRAPQLTKTQGGKRDNQLCEGGQNRDAPALENQNQWRCEPQDSLQIRQPPLASLLSYLYTS
jgi:hypothetical protein